MTRFRDFFKKKTTVLPIPEIQISPESTLYPPESQQTAFSERRAKVPRLCHDCGKTITPGHMYCREVFFSRLNERPIVNTYCRFCSGVRGWKMTKPDTEPTLRPNGKLYVPNKVPYGVFWEDEWGAERAEVVVIGTHDKPLALHSLAVLMRNYPSYHLYGPPGVLWLRDTLRRGERTLVDDPIHGKPMLIWEVEEG